MDPDSDPGHPSWDRVDRAFALALDQPAGERKRWVESRYSRDTALRDAVLDLLEGESASAAFFEAAESERDAVARIAAEEESNLGFAGQRLGPYRLVELLATGGMGAVYRAQRDDGEYDQTVAIKILPHWATDAGTVSRLRAERQILSSLQHPHITLLFSRLSFLPFFPLCIYTIL